jgi:ribosomal protein S18 acetylase RimI-like enzyme
MSEPATEQDVEFRYASMSDCAEVVALVESAYRGDVSRGGWTTEADLLDGQRTDAEEVTSILQEDGAHMLLAIEGKQLLGCVVMRREPMGAYIGMLAVLPGLQTKGLGKRLLGEAEARAIREFDAKHTRMTVIEQRKELIAWYERRGYRRTGHTEPFPYGDPRFGLPKRDDLRFVVLEKPLE